MSEVKWIKITTNIFDDEKIQLIESMPESDTIIVIWFKLLSLAGKSNNGGLVMISEKVPYTIEMLTTLFRRKKTVVQLALHTFEQFGMIEMFDNDTILISNWEKHQNTTGLDRIKEQNRLRQQKYRKKIKELDYKKEDKDIEGNVTNNVTDNVTNKNTKFNPFKTIYFDNQELQDLFIEFLQIRKKLKAVNTERAVKLQLNKLESHNDQIKKQMLENAISNSWKSVYELKKYGKEMPKDVQNDWLDNYMDKL
jgi:predicted phage replisome organizer